MTQQRVRLSDLALASPEVVTDGQSAPIPGFEIPLSLPTLSSIFIDTATTNLPSRIKSIVIIVTTNLTWTTAGQATMRVIGSRSPQAAAGGATSPTANNQAVAQLTGSANFGGAGATSIASAMYIFTPQDLAQLQWWTPCCGIEFQFPSALTGGAMTVSFEPAAL